MIQALSVLCCALVAATCCCWLRQRELRVEGERVAREFELMLQVQQAEHRTELLQAHALLMQAQQRLRHLEAGSLRQQHAHGELETSRR